MIDRHQSRQERIRPFQVERHGVVVNRGYTLDEVQLPLEGGRRFRIEDAVEGELDVLSLHLLAVMEPIALTHFERVLGQRVVGRPGLERPGRDVAVEPHDGSIVVSELAVVCAPL